MKLISGWFYFDILTIYIFPEIPTDVMISADTNGTNAAEKSGWSLFSSIVDPIIVTCLIEKAWSAWHSLNRAMWRLGFYTNLNISSKQQEQDFSRNKERALLPGADRHLKGISGTSGAAILMKDWRHIKSKPSVFLLTASNQANS